MLVTAKLDLRKEEGYDQAINAFKAKHNLLHLDWSSVEGKGEFALAFLKNALLANDRRREALKLPSDIYANDDTKTFADGSLLDMSVADALPLIADRYAGRKFIGERMYDEHGNRMNRYRWTTYGELGARFKKFAAGFSSLVPTRSSVSMCAENSVEWVVADMAIQCLNMISIMVHQTVADEEVAWVVGHAHLDAVITAPHLLKAFALASSKNEHLKVIILQNVDHGRLKDKIDTDALIAECQAVAGPHTRIYSHAQIEALGASLPFVPIPSTNDDELFTVSYTSGSTGRPKGLMLSSRVHKHQILEKSPMMAVSCIFAPLSHSSRRAVFHIMCGGGRLTLFNSDMAYLLEELQLTTPLVFIAVPRFWNILYGEYNSFVDLFKRSLPKKSLLVIQHIAKDLFLQLLGGRILQMAAGGAPSTPAVFDWMHTFDSVELVTETYGAMEIGSICLGYKLDDDCDWRLVDVPDMGYLTTDKPFPRGEFVAKSPLMFLGYHNSPEETSNALTEDGYFRTGDIIQVEGPEFIRVIDRKKFIFKLAQGEYVSPAKSEGFYCKSKFIAHMMCYGSSIQSYLVAVVVPDAKHLMPWAASLGITGVSFEQLCALPEIKKLIMSEMRHSEAGSQMRPFERALDIIVVSEDFTPENGLLTATSKLNRSAILNKYRVQLEALYLKDQRPDSFGDLDSTSKPSDDAATSNGSSNGHSNGTNGHTSSGSGQEEESESLSQIKALLSKVLSERGQDVYITNDLNLVASGLDSMSAIKLVNSLNRQLNISVPVSSLYQPGLTIQTLAQVVSSHKDGGDGKVALSAEATVEQMKEMAAAQDIHAEYDMSPYFWFSDILPTTDEVNDKRRQDRLEAEAAGEAEVRTQMGHSILNIKSKAATASFDGSAVENIFLTGCTGFLGLYLIKELLDAFPKANVHCLVRAAGPEDARKRLDKAITFANLHKLDPELTPQSADPARPATKYDRIKVVCGDLAQTRFGLTEEAWNELADTVDAIYHCGCWVNLIFPYHMLRDANVVSTVQLLRMALSGKKNRKQFHYVSTLSALAPRAQDITYVDTLFGFEGYPLTKRVCEVLLSRIERLIPDLPVVVHRVGAIFGHSTSGHVNIEAFIHKLFAGIVQYGYYPTANAVAGAENKGLDFNWAPVDYYAKAIAHIAKDGGVMAVPKRYNISNPAGSTSLTMEEFAAFVRSYGFKLEPKPWRTWKNELEESFVTSPGSNWLEPLRQMLEDSALPTPDHFDLSNTIASLAANIPSADTPAASCGKLSEPHIHSILRFCVEKGHLQDPNAPVTAQ